MEELAQEELPRENRRTEAGLERENRLLRARVEEFRRLIDKLIDVAFRTA